MVTLCNNMDDEYLSDCLLVYIGKKIVKKSSVDSIINDCC
jgi:hypothetical protein